MLATLLWVLTRTKPSVKICDLSGATYDQMCGFQVKANRRLVVNIHHVKHEAMLGELGTTPTAETISELAASLGFHEEWLVVRKPGGRGGPMQE